MSRSITAAMLAALAAESTAVALLVELQFGSGTVRLNSLDYDLTWSGQTWLGAGRVGRVSAVEESEAIQAYGVTLSLSGVDASLLAIALGEDYQGRTVRMWFAAFDAAYVVIDDPVLVYRGRMDTMRVRAGQNASIELTCEGRLADFERARVRRYNSADQQTVYPGDKFFDYAPQLAAGQAIWWGQATPAGAT